MKGQNNMKKKLAALLAVLLTFSSLTGCSNSGSSEETTSTDAAETTTVGAAATPLPDDMNTVVAYVEGQDDPIFNITFSDWYQEYKSYLLRNGIDETDSAYAETCADLRLDIINVLLLDRIILKEADLAGVGINELTPEELEQIDLTVEETYKNWCKSFEEDAAALLGESYTEQELYDKEYELFTDFLAQAGATTEMFLMWERNTLIQNKLYEHIRTDAQVSDEDVQEYVNQTIADAKEAYETDPKVYEEKYTAFYVPENTRVVEQIFFAFKSETANEITAYRNDGDNETADSLLAQAVRTELQDDIDAAKKALADGESWDDVQIIYNDDSNGNDASYIVYPKSSAVEERVTAAAMAIGEIGGVSELITTDHGCYLLCYTEDASLTDEDMTEMHSQCRDYLESMYLQTVVVEWEKKYPYTINYEMLNIEEPAEETLPAEETDPVETDVSQ